jgi:D-glycero-D-manno-heptose 1,7-bisphosphate phosphatase
MRPAVFLDRDGTMIHDPGHMRRLEDLRWYPWTIDALRLLNRAGFLVIVVTNQGGIGLELYDEHFVTLVHTRMSEVAASSGARIDGWYYCPHHPNATIAALRVVCDCRKPRPKLVHQAAEEFSIDLSNSFVVGDKVSDVRLAGNVGARGVLVRTGHGEEELAASGGSVAEAALVAADLIQATSWILARRGQPVEAAR